jgi:hypothetical protein
MLKFAAQLEKQIGLLHSVVIEIAQNFVNRILGNIIIRLPDPWLFSRKWGKSSQSFTGRVRLQQVLAAHGLPRHGF